MFEAELVEARWGCHAVIGDQVRDMQAVVTIYQNRLQGRVRAAKYPNATVAWTLLTFLSTMVGIHRVTMGGGSW